MTLLSTLALATALGGGGGSVDVSISEIRIDQPGSDNDEFFELAGAPGTDLTNVYYISIGDGSAGSGVVESITDLTGSVIPSSGYFVAAESSFSLGTADLVADLGFENSDNVTHMLVVGFTGALQDDLDTNDDGMLDVFPFSDVLDAVSLVETEYTGDRYYATVQFGGAAVGPDGSFVPAHSFRCSAGWQIGDFGTGSTETPGAANSPFCPGPRINEIRIDQPGSDDDEYFELLTEPGASLDGLSYIVIGDGSAGSGVVESITDLTGSATGGSGLFVCAESTFTLGPADLTATLGFENGDNVTHLLVRDFTGILQEDLDTDDDGVLDITPWSEVLDAVSLVEEIGGGDQYYGASLGFADLGPNGSFVPAQAVRCDEGWRIGTFTLEGLDTPGFPNFPCAGIWFRCAAADVDPISQGIVAMQGSGSIQLNDTSAFIYELPVDSFGVVIAGPAGPITPGPFGANCMDAGAVRISYGFASNGELTVPLDLTGLGPMIGSGLAVQYLYRDANAPAGARFSDAAQIILGL